MVTDEEKPTVLNDVGSTHNSPQLDGVRHADDVLLAKLGYKSEFKREFSVSLIASCKATGR